MQRTVLKVAGESGMGLLSIGSIVSRTLKHMGYYVHTDREYPSLIKGGHSNVQIDFGLEQIRSLSSQVDLVIALDRAGLVEYLHEVKPGGVLVHGFQRHHMIKDLQEEAKKRKIKLVYLPSRDIAHANGGNELMVNMVLLGLMWRVLGFDIKPLEAMIKKQFASKPKLLEIDLAVVRAGYHAEGLKKIPTYKIQLPKKKPKKILIDGSMSIALGALQAGVRAHVAYPMSPSSAFLMNMANLSHYGNLMVKQAEDEITAAQMATGLMHMGVRTTVSTSGGGFDLMTETFSLAGMIETPLVIAVAQRPGPATGLPTWTAQGDLHLAIHGGHGEYARMVIAASDPESCYELIQQSMNYAEEFQVPVVFLYEKVIAESHTMVDPFKQNLVKIKRGLITDKKKLAELKSSDRYKFTDSGVSPRWLPGSCQTGYVANSDEHEEDGTLTEMAEPCEKMVAKRLKKLAAIEKALPEPTLHGPAKAKISFVSWGSNKNAILDAMDICKKRGISVNYLHFDYLWPLKTGKLKKFLRENKNAHIVEGNATGQLADLIKVKTSLEPKRFLKYNGRPFFVDDIMIYLTKHYK